MLPVVRVLCTELVGDALYRVVRLALPCALDLLRFLDHAQFCFVLDDAHVGFCFR